MSKFWIRDELNDNIRPVKRNRQCNFPGALCLIVSCCLPVAGGQLLPCVKAVSSTNGNFIVIVETGLDVPGKAIQVSLSVLSKEGFVTRSFAPVTFWADWTLWSVVIDPSELHNEPECPLPLLTDDGEFMVLMQTGPTFATDHAVLRLYRRRDHPGDLIREGPDLGVFIKDIPLTDLWPADKVYESARAWDDETPEWFAGGAFNFSSDNRQLIHTTRWHSTVRIHLEDGFVERQ